MRMSIKTELSQINMLYTYLLLLLTRFTMMTSFFVSITSRCQFQIYEDKWQKKMNAYNKNCKSIVSRDELNWLNNLCKYKKAFFIKYVYLYVYNSSYKILEFITIKATF